MQEGNAVGCLGERVEAQAVSMNFLNKLGHSLRESAFSYILSITVGHTALQGYTGTKSRIILMTQISAAQEREGTLGVQSQQSCHLQVLENMMHDK